MTEDEKLSIACQLAVMDGKLDHIHDSLCKRVKFIEKIVFGFIGLIVVGTLAAIGTAVLWVLSVMGVWKP